MWRQFVDQAALEPEAAAEHVERAASAGRARRIAQGLYLIVDEGRPFDAIAAASQIFDPYPHYVTTDGALSHYGIADQPAKTYRVVIPSHIRRLRKGIDIQPKRIRPVNLSLRAIESSSFSATLTAASHKASIAEPEQAIADALAFPRWTEQFDLIPEYLGGLRERALIRTADLALHRSKAAAQRLGYALDSAGLKIPTSLTRLRPAKGVQYDPRHPGIRFSSRWAVYLNDSKL
jgi:predicted transcriptional regulator of viral defense system